MRFERTYGSVVEHRLFEPRPTQYFYHYHLQYKFSPLFCSNYLFFNFVYLTVLVLLAGPIVYGDMQNKDRNLFTITAFLIGDLKVGPTYKNKKLNTSNK